MGLSARLIECLLAFDLLDVPFELLYLLSGDPTEMSIKLFVLFRVGGELGAQDKELFLDCQKHFLHT